MVDMLENNQKTPSLLLIDDEANLLLGLKAILQRAGYSVETASNGEDGLRKASALHPDMILCDVMMPSMNGFQLKEQLAKDPECAAIPFIFLTARSAQTDKLAGLRGGADDYITKPFDINELLVRVEALLRRTEASRQKGLQEADGKIEELRRTISSNLSHEMRTPLSNVITTLEMALQDRFNGSPEDLNWYLETALNNANRLHQLSEDLIMLSKIDQGNVNTFREDIDLEYNFHSTVNLAARRWEAKNLAIKITIAPMVSIHAPKLEFTQVVSHLVDNACKFSPDKGEVSVLLEPNGVGGCILTIHNQGERIPPELRERVFERYYQVQQGDARPYDGLGIGLTLARHFAQTLKGDVVILDSGEGCTVRMTIGPAPLSWISDSGE